MTAKQSPFFNINYGWNYGENGWNTGMDQNLKNISFLLNKTIISQVGAVPVSPIEGDSYILSTTGLIYSFIDSQWVTFTPYQGMQIYDNSLSTFLIYSGGVWSVATSSNVLKIAYIGDSLTQNSARNASWAQQTSMFIEQLLGIPVVTKNVAIGGSTWDSAQNTNQHEGATKTQVQEVIAFEPDLVFVALGINDALFVGGYTSAQIISNAQAMYTTLKAALPKAKIIYSEEVPHDLTAGVSPASLTNKDTVPFSHTLLSLNGLTNVRINSTGYLNTAITGAALTKHQTWGTATTTIRATYDGYFSANLWKMARMGCMVDALHIDTLGHCLWAWQAVSYLAGSGLTVGNVSMSKLNFSNLSSPILNIDLLYTEFTNGTIAGNMPAVYKGFSSFERAKGWMMYSPSARMDTDSAIADASRPLSVSITKAVPNRPISTSVNSTTFVSAGRSTSEQGTHLQTFIPGVVFTDMNTAGTHTVYFAVQNPDSSYDVFQKSISVGASAVQSGAYSIKRCDSTSSISLNTLTTLNFTTTLVDEVGVGSNFTKIIIPASLNGKKFRLKANVRFSIGTTASDTAVAVFCGMTKNGLAATGNSLISGLGLPSQFTTVSLSAAGTGTRIFDMNLASSILTASTGDYFEVKVQIDKTSADTASQVASNYTWFSLEVV